MPTTTATLPGVLLHVHSQATPAPTTTMTNNTTTTTKPPPRPTTPTPSTYITVANMHTFTHSPGQSDANQTVQSPSTHVTISPSPLARVSSHPTFVPVMQIDFDAVAHSVSLADGGPSTAADILDSLADPHHHAPPAVPLATSLPSCAPSFLTRCARAPSTQSSAHPSLRTSAPMTVELAHFDREQDDNQQHHIDRYEQVNHIPSQQQSHRFSDETLVLKIRPEADRRDCWQSHVTRESGPNNGCGFAISIPFHDDEMTNRGHAYASSWPLLGKHVGMVVDEEAPLLPTGRAGLDLSFSRMDLPSTGAAFVQRCGPRDVAEEQEVLCALPNADVTNGNTGLFIPVVDSSDDLKELVLVVPPTDEEDEKEMEKQDAEVLNGTMGSTMRSTVETAREVVETLSNMIPPMVEVDSTLEVHGTARNATVSMNVTKQVSWVGYMILAVALFSVASQGTAVKWLPSVDGMIAASWLMQCQTLLMVPFCMFQLVTMRSDERRVLKERSTLQLMVAGSVAQVCWACGFFLAIDYTSLFHAWALNNVHALTMVVVGVVKKTMLRHKTCNVSGGEVYGARIASAGVLVMQLPAIWSNNTRGMTGDAIAMLSSVGAIGFLDICKRLRTRVPLFVMLTPISGMNGALFAMASHMVLGTDGSMSDHGALGWMQSERIGLGVYLGGVVGLVGTVCCIAALKFVPSVVVGSVQTMMPVVGTMMAFVAGVDELPDLWTSAGGAMLLYGVLVIANASRHREVTVVLNEHISEVRAAKHVDSETTVEREQLAPL